MEKRQEKEGEKKGARGSTGRGRGRSRKGGWRGSGGGDLLPWEVLFECLLCAGSVHRPRGGSLIIKSDKVPTQVECITW